MAGYDLVAETPNAQDLIDGFNCAGKEELATSAEKFRLVIERVLLPHHAALARAGLTPKDLSDFIQRSTKAVSQTARDKAHLLRLLRSLKHLCLSACEMQRERCEPRH